VFHTRQNGLPLLLSFPMLDNSPSVGPAVTFWIYAGVSLLSFLFVGVMVPETKGRTLEEIGVSWSKH